MLSDVNVTKFKYELNIFKVLHLHRSLVLVELVDFLSELKTLEDGILF